MNKSQKHYAVLERPYSKEYILYHIQEQAKPIYGRSQNSNWEGIDWEAACERLLG